MANAPSDDEQSVATIKDATGLIMAVTENRNWIEVFFEDDLMHTRPSICQPDRGSTFYSEEIPHKTTCMSTRKQ